MNSRATCAGFHQVTIAVPIIPTIQIPTSAPTLRFPSLWPWVELLVRLAEDAEEVLTIVPAEDVEEDVTIVPAEDVEEDVTIVPADDAEEVVTIVPADVT